MRIEVRLAKKSDKKVFVRLALERDSDINELSVRYYPPFRNSIGNPVYWNEKFDKLVASNRLFLACIDKKPVGFVHFALDFIDYPAAYIELIFVSKTSRRLGIAKQLLAKAEKAVSVRGYTKVFSSTNPDNPISLKMHKKLGYKRCGSIYGIETPTSREIFVFKNLQRPKKR